MKIVVKLEGFKVEMLERICLSNIPTLQHFNLKTTKPLHQKTTAKQIIAFIKYGRLAGGNT